MGRMGGMSLNGEGEKEEDTAGTEETRSQTVHPPPLCWGPSATKETADGGLGSTALKSARPPTYYPHTSLSLSHAKLSGSSVWVNSAPSGIPAVRQIWGCQLTWFLLCVTAEDSRGAERLSTIFV